MTGTPAADSYLGCTSTATQTFHLVQEFEVTCSDPSVQTVSLTLDSSLVGYVRSTRKAAACVRLASATIAPRIMGRRARWRSFIHRTASRGRRDACATNISRRCKVRPCRWAASS